MSCPHKESCEVTRRERDLLHDTLNNMVAEQLALDTGIIMDMNLKQMAEACGLGYLMDESDEFFAGPKLEALVKMARANTRILSFDEIEDCFPEGSLSDDETGKTLVSAQWLHDFARNIEATAIAAANEQIMKLEGALDRSQELLAARELITAKERAISVRLLDALKVQHAHEYNPFEPDNQSAHYKKISDVIAEVEAMRKEKPE